MNITIIFSPSNCYSKRNELSFVCIVPTEETKCLSREIPKFEIPSLEGNIYLKIVCIFLINTHARIEGSFKYYTTRTCKTTILKFKSATFLT
jgi:hypothetical protein